MSLLMCCHYAVNKNRCDKLCELTCSGSPDDLEAFMKHQNLNADSSLKNFFGYRNDRIVHYAIYYGNDELVRYLCNVKKVDLLMKTR